MSIRMSASLPLAAEYHEGDMNGPRRLPTYVQWVARQKRNHELREHASFIMGSKPALPLLHRWTWSLSFEAVCYINILETIVLEKNSVTVFL